MRTIFGDSVIAVDEHGDGVDVTFALSRPERFDIVIRAGRTSLANPGLGLWTAETLRKIPWLLYGGVHH